jgi:hypothetical protein
MNKEKKKITKKETIFLVIFIMISVVIVNLILRNTIENFWIQLAILSGIMAVVGLILRFVIRWNRLRSKYCKKRRNGQNLG